VRTCVGWSCTAGASYCCWNLSCPHAVDQVGLLTDLNARVVMSQLGPALQLPPRWATGPAGRLVHEPPPVLCQQRWWHAFLSERQPTPASGSSTMTAAAAAAAACTAHGRCHQRWRGQGVCHRSRATCGTKHRGSGPASDKVLPAIRTIARYWRRADTMHTRNQGLQARPV
jgi:hypothetical protein